jgi:hypothetical protein
VNVKDYEARLYQLPCVVCEHMGINGSKAEELHHAGPADERDDWNQLPLCVAHHRGPSGIHGLHRRGFTLRYKLTDFQMLAMTRKLYAQEFGA